MNSSATSYRTALHPQRPLSIPTQICQTPWRSTGTRSPEVVMPVTSTSGEPIMKSTCTSLRLRGGSLGHDDDLDPAEVIATIFRMRTGAA